MKFKYYLRGAGFGIIITTLIFTIVLLRYEPTLSADEIREKAAKLGMVMPEETASGDAQEGKSPEDEQSTEVQSVDKQDGPAEQDEGGDTTEDKPNAESETKPEADEGEKEVTTIRFVVKGGQFSDVVSNNLAAKGLVPDGEIFNKWLMEHHYDSDIQPGVYYIKSDATYKEIAEMITEIKE